MGADVGGDFGTRTGTGAAAEATVVMVGGDDRKRRVEEIEAARDQRLLNLFSLMRAEVDGDEAGDATSGGVTNVRSELVFRRVLMHLEERRRRGTWLQRALRPVIAALAALAGSRAVRLLMP